MAGGYSYNTANAGAYGSADLKKKKPAAMPAAGAPASSPAVPRTNPAYGGGGPVAGGQVRTEQVTSTGGGLLPRPEASPNPGGKDVNTWDSGLYSGKDSIRPQPVPVAAPPVGGGGATEEELDQALQDQLAALLGEGPRSTEEIEGVIGEQMDRSLEDELGRIMAMAGGLGAGRAGSTAVGMGDAARENALARQDAILGAQRDAEKDWLDRLNASAGLYGRELEIRSMDDYYRLMNEIFGVEEPTDSEAGGQQNGPGVLDQAGGTISDMEAMFWGAPPGVRFDSEPPPANAQIISEATSNGVRFVIWQDPATGAQYMSPADERQSALASVTSESMFGPGPGVELSEAGVEQALDYLSGFGIKP